MKRVWLGALVAAVCAFGIFQPRGHAQGQDALNFFKNYFVTGDYVVAGVGLATLGGQNGSPAGIATGTISLSGANAVPPNAEVVAAYLYWQVVSTSSAGPDSGAVNATFDGSLLSSADGPYSKALISNGTAPCWSSGGSTGSSGGNKLTYTYRADVRRFLPVDADGKAVANGQHTVQLPDSGSGNSLPIALGASLVVIYRDPTLPLKAVVLYDGGYTMNNTTDSMSQTIRGFYQAANTSAKLTHIVGSGQANKSENLRFNGGIIAVNPFVSAQGEAWDNYTTPVTLSALTETPAPTTSVDHAGFGSFDCLTWGAIVFSTAVQDTDGDGLLDLWESSQSTLFDPNGHALPNLKAMGADPAHKDLFVEIGYMKTDVDTAYGGVVKPAHSHLPDPTALKTVGDTFAAHDIHVHFDVGGNYQNGEAGPYVIPAALARGGDAIDESVTNANCPSSVCEFLGFPGTVGWKVGYKFYRDQLVSPNAPPLDAFGNDPCDLPGADDGPGGVCERRFDRNRLDMFHYVLGAHFIGLPQSEFPCLDGSNPPVPVAAQIDGTCAVADNPNFHIPRTSSGVSDFPGGDVMVTLGGFTDAAGKPVGTPFMQGATLLHELGHNFDLSHSGVYQPANPVTVNCKPNYLSSMNYLFQLRGLFNDDPLNPGVPHMDYSSQRLGPLNETSLNDATGLGNDLDSPYGSPLYHTGWYSPNGIGSPATKHCDGTPLLATDVVPMIRVDGPSVAGGAIDWAVTAPTVNPQDLNFDGVKSLLAQGANDWANLHLTQLATRRNVLGFSVDFGRDGLGRGDTLGRDGLGRDGLGRDGLGRDGLGRDGLGRDGLGRDGLGRDGLGRDGLGRDGLGRDGLGVGELHQEVDTAIAAASGYAPPNTVTAIVKGLGNNCSGLSPADCHRIVVSWSVPTVNPDQVVMYLVFRYPTLTGTPSTASQVGQPVPSVSGQSNYSATDSQELPNGSFTYFVIAAYPPVPPSNQNTFSGPSNYFPIVAVNDAPAAHNDSYDVNVGSALNVGPAGVLGNDTDDDSPTLTAGIVSGPSHASAFNLNSDGSFNYTPAAGFVGTDTFTYKAIDADPAHNSTATVSITVHDVTPPVVTLTVPSPNAQGWFTTKPVVVGVSATDPSTVTAISCTDGVLGAVSNLGTTTASASLSFSTEGTHTFSCSATDGANNTGAAPGSSAMPVTVKIDTVAPTVTINAPLNNATVILKSTVAASFSCSDGAVPPSSGMASCVGTVANGANIDTSTVGPKNFTVTGKDVAGNTTTVTNTYTVIYAVAITPLKTPATQGSAVPVIWTEKDALGNSINDLSTVLKIESVYNGAVPAAGCVASAAGTHETLYSPATGATGGSNLRLVSPGYQFNWDTTSTTTAPIVTPKGCYTVLIYLNERPDLTNPRLTSAVQLK